jgi:hypothetical protein
MQQTIAINKHIDFCTQMQEGICTMFETVAIVGLPYRDGRRNPLS